MLMKILDAQPQVQTLWLRLPDGHVSGIGYESTNYESLLKIFFGDIKQISNVDKTASFTIETLENAISEIIVRRQPDKIRVLDYISTDDDHMDHLISARIVERVAEKTGYADRLIGLVP